jgi:hypothetical protein
MTDTVIIAHIWSMPKAYAKWCRLDTKGKQFVLKQLNDNKVTEAAVTEAVKAWKKKRKATSQ